MRLPLGGMIMNKHSMRWISMLLSIAVMIGSLTYIAAGFNAETDVQREYLASASSSSSSGLLLDTDDVISTDDDRMTQTVTDTWVYESVLRDNGFLVDENGSADNADVFFDIVPDGSASVAVGDKVGLSVTMENTTANDTRIDSETQKTVSNAVDVEAVTFSLAYNGTHLKFISGKSNIEGVEFTVTGTGSGTAVVVTYKAENGKAKLQAHEMPIFDFEFEAVKSTGEDPIAVSIKNDATVLPASLRVKSGLDEMYMIYPKNGNSALSELSIELKNEGAENTKVVLNPEFDPEINDYFITVPYDTVKGNMVINAVTADPKAKATCSWAQEGELAAGMNHCTITVEAADGSAKEYNIAVKKLSLDTLADPQTTLVKTVKLLEKGSASVKDAYSVSYKISGKNDLLAGGNDYLVYVSALQRNEIDPEAIRANTANLEDSVLVIAEAGLTRTKLTTYDLSSPSLKSTSEYVNGIIKPEEFILTDSRFSNDNRFVILADNDVEQPVVTENAGYTEIVLPDDENMTANLAAAGVDNTAAEFVFILDFSNVRGGKPNQIVNNGIVKSVFGFNDSDGTVGNIPGYIKQIEDLLSNDSTAKVTVIAIGADIGADEPEEDWDKYGVKFVSVSPSDAVLTDSYKYDYTNSVYTGQTYLMPQAENEIWGFTATKSEQHNLWEYCESFTERNAGTSSGASSTNYEQAVTAESDLLDAQFDVAMLEAKGLLADANNAQLVVITPNSDKAANAFAAKIGSSAGITASIIPVDEYRAESTENVVASEIYKDLVVRAKEKFNCDPGSNQRVIRLVDEINRQVFQLTGMNANMSVNNASALDIENVRDQFKVDVTWYLPAIGEYELYADYNATRWSNYNVKTDTHYYPVSNTVKTELSEDGPVVEDDIPTVAPSYDDEYELTITKALKSFEDAGAAKPEDSTITYVLLYKNTGTFTLTNVGITDSQIMLAGNNYKIYILAPGQNKPGSNDYPLSNKFTSAGGNKGETTISSLEPGETIYVEYTVIVPEATNVTTGTTRTEPSEANKVITSYIIDNIATGASKEVDATQVELKVEFEYDKDSGGTVSTSTSATTSTTTTTTQAPTTTTTTVPTTLPTVTTYKISTTTTTKIIYKEDIPTGESSVGYIVAMSLLFGAIGVFGVTVYGIMLDKKIQRAAEASGRKNINR